MDDDPFDSVLGLEDRFYNEGYQLGEADGQQAGLVEGRLFGLENGFDKFLEMGRLHGRSIVWTSRLAHSQEQKGSITHMEAAVELEGTTSTPRTIGVTPVPDHSGCTASTQIHLPPLSGNLRLEKQIRTFHALVELVSLSTLNKEDDVADFDDRLKRAIGKAKIIEKIIGEDADGLDASANKNPQLPQVQSSSHGSGESNIEDVNVLQARH